MWSEYFSPVTTVSCDVSIFLVHDSGEGLTASEGEQQSDELSEHCQEMYQLLMRSSGRMGARGPAESQGKITYISFPSLGFPVSPHGHTSPPRLPSIYRRIDLSAVDPHSYSEYYQVVKEVRPSVLQLFAEDACES